MNRTGPRRILIVVANRTRDAQASALLGYYLSSVHGLEVGYVEGAHLEARSTEGGFDLVVFDQLCWDYRVRAALNLKRLGARIVLLPTSGFFQKADQHRHLELAGKLFGAQALVDRFLAGGAEVQELLIQSGTLEAERVSVTGFPRFDFYRPPFVGLAGGRKEFLDSAAIPRHDAPLIVWTPSNTAYGGLQRKSLLHWATSTGMPVGDVRAEIEDVLEQHRQHSLVVSEIALRRPNWNFLVKVHPSDRIDAYRAMVGRASNIFVRHDLPIEAALRHADIVLQRYSTTANEAWILGKPVFLLDIGRYNFPLDDGFRRGCDVVSTVDQCEEVIGQRLRGEPGPKDQLAAQQTFLERNFFRLDGKSAQRCATIVNDVLLEGSRPCPPAVRASIETALQRTRARGSLTEIAGRVWRRVKRLGRSVGRSSPPGPTGNRASSEGLKDAESVRALAVEIARHQDGYAKILGVNGSILGGGSSAMDGK